MTSSRLPDATNGEVLNYYIDLEPAHTTLAQACLGVLLQIQHAVEGCTPRTNRWPDTLPSTGRLMRDLGRCHHVYTKGWNNSSTRTNHTLRCGSPYTIKTPSSTIMQPFTGSQQTANPPHRLPHITQNSGFHDLIEHLTKHPPDVNAGGGYYVRRLVAALAGEHFQTADLLRLHGADLDVPGRYGRNPLYSAANSGNLEVVRILIEYNPAYINAGDEGRRRPLPFASAGGRHFKDYSVHQLLLEHGTDINVQDQFGHTLCTGPRSTGC